MILYRYFRRRGLRWAIVGLQMTVVAGGLAAMTLAADIGFSDASIFVITALIGIVQITRAIRSVSGTSNVIALSPDVLSVPDGTTLMLASAEISRLVERKVDEEMRKARMRGGGVRS